MYYKIAYKNIAPLLQKAALLAVLVVISNLSIAETIERNSGQSAHLAAMRYAKFGQHFADVLNKRDLKTLADLFDMDAFAYRTGRFLFDSDNEIKNFVKGFVKNPEEKFLKQVFSVVFTEKTKAIYLRVLKKDEPLIRIDYQNGGYEYLILHLNELTNGKFVVVDMFRMTSGKDISASIAAAAQLMLKPSKSLLKRLFGRVDVDSNLVTSFKKIGMLRRSGKYKEAYTIVESFPEKMRKTRAMLDLSIMLAQSVNDVEYKKQLALLDKYYGNDDSTAFILVDYYFLNHDYAKVQAALDRLIAYLGEDGALYTLKANASIKSGDYEKAKKYCKKAIKIEPQFESAYWSLANALTADKEYGALIKDFDVLEKRFGYAFKAKSFLHNKFYSKFVQSPEFKARFRHN